MSYTFFALVKLDRHIEISYDLQLWDVSVKINVAIVPIRPNKIISVVPVTCPKI